jgi:hypothetical protein
MQRKSRPTAHSPSKSSLERPSGGFVTVTPELPLGLAPDQVYASISGQLVLTEFMGPISHSRRKLAMLTVTYTDLNAFPVSLPRLTRDRVKAVRYWAGSRYRCYYARRCLARLFKLIICSALWRSETKLSFNRGQVASLPNLHGIKSSAVRLAPSLTSAQSTSDSGVR